MGKKTNAKDASAEKDKSKIFMAKIRKIVILLYKLQLYSCRMLWTILFIHVQEQCKTTYANNGYEDLGNRDPIQHEDAT